MTKLLTEPRVIKEISDVKSKKKVFKKTDRKCVNYTLIREGDKTTINELIRVYKEDPFKARVKFFNSSRGTYVFNRLVLFEFDNGDFEFCEFKNSFGISVTNKMYSSQKKVSSVIYTKGRFWLKRNTIKPLFFNNLISFINDCETFTYNNLLRVVEVSKIYSYFNTKFHWFRAVYDSEGVAYNLTFNRIVKDKLYKLRDMTLASVGVNHKISKVILSGGRFANMIKQNNGVYIWKEYLRYMDNTHCLKSELVESEYFYDTCKMAKTLGRKVNCKWSLRRLKEEHDKWAKEITKIVLECEVEYDLKISQIYRAFSEYSGFRLLKTNKEMLAEGMIQNHCVGTYINSVQSGYCGIYHINGYTLELKCVLTDNSEDSNKKLKIIQFKGKYNVDAPVELFNMVNKEVESFNNSDISKEIYQEEIWGDFGVNLF